MAERRSPGALAFFTLTFAWSWSFFGLAIASGAEWPALPALVPFALGAIGPALVAVLLTWRAAGKNGAAALVRRAVAFQRIRARWWALLAVVPNALAIALQTAVAGKVPESVSDSGLTIISPLGILAFALLAGLAEEPGWRGYAFERLRHLPLLGASLLVGIGWSLWHLLYFFIDGTFQNELGVGTPAFWWFFLQIIPTAVLIAWFYTRTGRLIAASVAFHALGNAAGELLPVEGGGRWLSLALLTVLTAGVVVHDRRLFTASRNECGASRCPPARASP